VTRAGRLYRIDVESGRTEERLANTPTPSQSLDSGVPGSTYHLAGTGFSAGTAVAQPPLPRSLAGLRVLLNGQPMPLLVVSPGEVRFQVPWDTAPSSSNMLSIEPGSDVELEPPPLNLPVTDFEARLPGYPQPNVVPSEAFLSPAHQNFESLVTAHQPARPGEIVHLFGTGFGPVVSPPPTGERGMSPTVRPVECTSSSGPVETVYSGLAPSMVGYYQISLRLPDTLKAPAVYLQCTGFYGMIHTTGS